MKQLIEKYKNTDPRYFQYLALGILSGLQITRSDFGTSLEILAITLYSVAFCHIAFSFLLKTYHFDVRSSLITGFSLSLLLRANEGDIFWVYPLAAFIAVGGKALITVEKRHIFNPAALAIIVLLLALPHYVWVSPGQWGSAGWLAGLLVCLASLVLTRAASWDVALMFLASWAVLIFGRALWLGDPVAIPLHNIQSGALLIFAFFMISDPMTVPKKRLERGVFVFLVALLAFILHYEFRIREGLFYALIMMSFMWAFFNYRGKLKMKISNLHKAFYLCFAVLMMTTAQAQAFCGFFVSKAGTDLFNEASKVVLARAENRTVITMVNDFKGDAKDFAIVVPVPAVLKEGQINVTENRIVEHLDAYTAPRLVEYFDENPCQQRMYEMEAMQMAPTMAMDRGTRLNRKSAKQLGVTIEAEYTVGEYDIQILSAKESDGLLTWLNQEDYKLPKGAEKILGSYIKQEMKFFVAKVNLEEQSKLGYTFLRPLQVAYEHKKFMLPIRLGTLNANGAQDMIAFTLTQKGRVEASNYRTVKIPSNMDVPIYVKNEFGDFYKAMFNTAAKKEKMKAVFLEYAWDMGWCDPCAADPLSNKDLRTLGVWWVDAPMEKEAPPQFSPRVMPPRGGGQNVFVTRLHARYTADTFPEDLMLHETSDRQNFQGRYVLRHPFKGEASCNAGHDYFRSLPTRFEKEAQTLSNLTGWNVTEIRSEMEKNGQSFVLSDSVKNPKPWWDRIWDK